MNDFTKDELEYLYQAIYERPNTITEKMDSMRDKIQSMIDNYCEHEHKEYAAEDNRPMIMTHECLKCGKDFIE